MKTDLKKVLAVSEYSGLFFFVSDSKNGIIVESATDKKRTCMSPRARMTSLSDIAVYTDSGELKLRELFERMKALPAETELPHVKSEPKVLQKFFEQVIPDYDRDRFYFSHMKKVVDWFRILKENDALDFEEDSPEELVPNGTEEPVPNGEELSPEEPTAGE